jgi:transcriptional regulator with XRE-family HTH domain
MVDKVLRLRSSCETMDVAKRSTYDTVEPKQAKELGRQLRARREELGLSLRQLEKLTDVDNGTIARIEQGAFAAPAPDKLARIAEGLGLSLADVFGLAEYAVPSDLPSFQPYLRSKYRDMPRGAVDDLNKAFARIVRKHGYDPEGPQSGEDEAP